MTPAPGQNPMQGQHPGTPAPGQHPMQGQHPGTPAPGQHPMQNPGTPAPGQHPGIGSNPVPNPSSNPVQPQNPMAPYTPPPGQNPMAPYTPPPGQNPMQNPGGAASVPPPGGTMVLNDGSNAPLPSIPPRGSKVPARTMAISEFSATMTPAPETAQEVTLGRQPANTIVLEAPDISGWHARVTRHPNGGLLIEDQGSTNGTYVNGERITSKIIGFADVVRLGSILVSMADPRIAGLLLRVNRRPQKGQPITIGTSGNCDVMIADPQVAPQHASITETPDGLLLLRDLNSPTGTFVDSPNFRVSEARVAGTQLVLLGTFALPMPVLGRMLEEADPTGLGRSLALGDALSNALQSDKPVITIGREPGNDLVIPHPTISARHATLTRGQDGTVQIQDLGSSNGSYINGQRVKIGVARPGDVVTVGAVSLTIGAGGRIEGASRAKVRLDLIQIGFVVKDRGTGQPRALLDSISFSIYPNELIGMLGPSGAGKTTLLMTVLGLNRPTSGGVLLNGKPLFAQYESFRTNVGYVPQDDIVHPELTVREALYYACRLRLPKGLSRSAIDSSIEATLKQVGLWEQRDLQIGSAEEKVLSGGQRRRVNLAVELVTDPSLLILDEPTSGLSWTDAADVVATLRRLADDGRTVVLTIHQPDFQEYEKFDEVAIMGKGGKLLFFGPPDPDSYTFFGAERGRPREMFDHVEQMEPDAWRDRFHQTETFRRFIVERGPKQDHQAQQPPPKPRSRSSLRQFPTLLARTMKLTLRSKTAMLILLLQAPLLGVLIGLTIEGPNPFADEEAGYRAPMFGCLDTPDQGDWCAGTEAGQDDRIACDPARQMSVAHLGEPPHADKRIPDPRIGLIAILMALFLPMVVASSNVLVGERTIYERERLAGLNIFPYVAARFSVLVILGAVVVLLNMTIAVPWLGLEGGLHKYLFIGFLTTSCAAAIGLALSAGVKRPVSALWGINLIVIPQLLFAGGIVRLEGITNVFSWLTTTRYGLEALVNVDLHSRPELQLCQIKRYMYNYPGFRTELDYPILQASAGIIGITVGALILTTILLKLKDKA
ncbi:MAG: FHA domain-containing protein [Myxococcota bacterium]